MNYERILLIWFLFSILKSALKDNITLIESSRLDDFLLLAKGSAIILGLSSDFSVSFFFELV